MSTGDPFAGVVRQRNELGHAMQRVESAAAAPAATESWLADLQQALGQLADAFDAHSEQVQSPLGLLDQIVDRAPRLQRVVEGTRKDHSTVSKSLRDALEATKDEATDRDAIREMVMEVLTSLARHRQKGADLIYDAYDIDIGGY